MLWLQDLRVDQVKESYIRVNTRELNKVSSTNLFTLYMLGVKFTNGGLSFFSILFFIFIFMLFYFSIFRTTRVKVDLSHCHISHNLMV